MSIDLHGVVGRDQFQREVHIALQDGEVLAITGVNGSGKSTIVHTVAGLVPLISGTLSCDGNTWDAPTDHIWVNPENRSCAVVFQDVRLFPHMKVIANVTYGLRAKRTKKNVADATATDVLAQVGLAGYEERRVTELSGGERQRVALARALVMKPRVLLLDEPFAAVDAESREGLRTVLAEVMATFGGATILVSHDTTDVESLATARLALPLPQNHRK